jgi:hypothetical protein
MALPRIDPTIVYPPAHRLNARAHARHTDVSLGAAHAHEQVLFTVLRTSPIKRVAEYRIRDEKPHKAATCHCLRFGT